MTDPLAQLTAGLARDEAVARATSQSASHLSPDWHTEIEGDIVVVLDAHQARVAVDIGVAAEQIANWDPKRAIEQAAVFREIAEALTAAVKARDSEDPHAYNAFTAGERSAAVMWLDWVVERLASIYPAEES